MTWVNTANWLKLWRKHFFSIASPVFFTHRSFLHTSYQWLPSRDTGKMQPTHVVWNLSYKTMQQFRWERSTCMSVNTAALAVSAEVLPAWVCGGTDLCDDPAVQLRSHQLTGLCGQVRLRAEDAVCLHLLTQRVGHLLCHRRSRVQLVTQHVRRVHSVHVVEPSHKCTISYNQEMSPKYLNPENVCSLVSFYFI